MIGYTFSDFQVEFKPPTKMLADINASMVKLSESLHSIPITLRVSDRKTMRKVHHFKGRRYVTRYSMLDVLSRWFR